MGAKSDEKPGLKRETYKKGDIEVHTVITIVLSRLSASGPTKMMSKSGEKGCVDYRVTQYRLMIEFDAIWTLFWEPSWSYFCHF